MTAREDAIQLSPFLCICSPRFDRPHTYVLTLMKRELSPFFLSFHASLVPPLPLSPSLLFSLCFLLCICARSCYSSTAVLAGYT